MDEDIDKDMADTLAGMEESGGSQTGVPDAVPSGGSSPSPSLVDAAPTPSPEPWNAIPGSWKKDYEPKWQAFDPDIRKYIHEREKQALDGIMQYKPTADKWQAAVKPYEKAFQQFGIDPFEAFGSISQKHMILKYGTPEQRAEVAKKMIEDYGLAEYMQQGQAAAYDPRLVARLDQIEAMVQQREVQAAQAEVVKFFSNPENEFAKEVATDMNHLLETGMASDLGKAYELAIWQNPGTRSKLLEREAAKIAGNRQPQLREVKSSDTPPSPTGGVSETLEETLANTYANVMKTA